MRSALKEYGIALLVIAVHLLVFSGINSQLNPHPDMIDHWVWSRFPSLSYYEHPPMVAWLIRLITLIGGNTESALENGALFYNLLVLIISYFIVKALFGKTAALINLLLLESAPYFSLGSVFLHIDQAFMLFWLLALYALCRFHQTEQNRWLLLIGLLAGLGALSKYIMILFYGGMGLHLLIYSDLRKHFKRPHLYAAGVLSLLCFIPVLLWNGQHDWVSFKFQFKRGLSGGDSSGKNFALFTLGHLLLFSAVWTWWFFKDQWNQRKRLRFGNSPESVIVVVSLIPLIFFSLMSLKGDIADPHWANVTYLGLMMVAANRVAEGLNDWRRNFFQRALIGGLLLNGCLVLLLVLHLHAPLIDLTRYQLNYYDSLRKEGIPESVIQALKPLKKQQPLPKEVFLQKLAAVIPAETLTRYQTSILNNALEPDRLSDTLGWEDSALQIRRILSRHQFSNPDYVVSKEFQLSAEISFYLPNHPRPHSIEKPERNQWSPVDLVRKGKTIVVCQTASCGRVHRKLKASYQMTMIPLGEFTTEAHHRILRHLEVYQAIPIEPLFTPDPS